PIPRAELYLVDGRETRNQTERVGTSNGAGEAALRIFENRCTLFVRAATCAPRWIFFTSIPETQVDVVLEAGRSVEVELVKSDGSLFQGSATVMLHSSAPRPVKAEFIGQGRFRLDELPDGEVLLWILTEDHALHRVHDTSIPFVRVAIGDIGRIEVTLRGAGASESPPWQFAAAPPGSARDFARSPLSGREPDLHRGTLMDLPPGAYEVWLEQPAPGQPDAWRRVGRPSSVVIDAEHPLASLEWSMPR
ncbi:MAG TPA: hypothetical protein VM509_06600, partial [Planctomycetota bacterium]|nr:hypothetical protein [Planctomycetota bacterium]